MTGTLFSMVPCRPRRRVLQLKGTYKLGTAQTILRSYKIEQGAFFLLHCLNKDFPLFNQRHQCWGKSGTIVIEMSGELAFPF